MIPAQAKEACSAWKIPAEDASGGEYRLELRVCEVTYGLTAYVQVQNFSDTELDLFYRITFASGKERDEHTTIPPSTILKVGMCQDCAKRHDGFKSWQIVEVGEKEEEEEIPEDDGIDEPIHPLEDTTISEETEIKPESQEPEVVEPEVIKPEMAEPEVKEPEVKEPKAIEPPKIPEPKQDVPKAEETSDEEESGEPAFNIEDLPPEFRPR